MDRQPGRKPIRRARESPDMQRLPERDRMSPGSDRYDGRGGGKMGGRVRSMERDDRRGDMRESRRPQRDDRDQPFTNYDRPQSFQSDGYKREPDCLRISNFPSHVSDTAIRDALFHEFKKYGEVNVRVVFNNAKNERIAYVKFRLPEQARDAKQARGDRLTLFARPLHIVAIVNKTNRDQGSDGGFMSRQNDFQGRRQYGGMQGRNFRQDMGAGGRGRDRDFQYDNRRNYGNDNHHQGQGRDRDRDAMFLPEDDPKATRTVFCGNLEDGITESEIRHHFERYGFVEDVDIKYPPRGQGNPFAFVKYENLDMAYKAIISMSGQYIGRNQCKTGYGKQSPTNCLWVGGLGPWITLGVLEREFDRFGAIRKIDYVKGDSFAYIQYETVEAAQAAASHMRGIPLGGPDKRLRVDFAEGPGVQGVKKPFRYQQSPSHHDDSVSGRGYSRYNQDRDFGPDMSPPTNRDGQDQWHGSGGNYDGQSRGNWQSGKRYSRNDTWIRKEGDQSGRMMQRMDNRRKRAGSPDEYIRDDWSPSNNSKAPKRRKSPGMDMRDWSPDHRRSRGDVSPRGRDWDTSPIERMRRQRSLSSDLSDHEDFDGQPMERRRRRGKRSKIPDGIIRLPDLVRYLSMSWRGHLVLKNSAFATRMFLVGGDANTAENLLPRDLGSDDSALKITQRLRLDQPKLEEIGKRISQAGSGGHAILLAMPGSTDDSESLPTGTQSRALLNLVTYLQQKQAAGVISLPVSGAQNKDNVGVLHAFPPCEFSHKYLLDIAPGLGPDPSKDDHLLVIIVKGVA